jgi:Capsule assembly protein Wzi
MKICFTFLLIFAAYNLFAQQEIGEVKRETKYSLEAGAYLSTDGNTPFWLRANQYGIVPLESNFVTLRGGIHSDYKKANSKEADYKLSKFDWGYGLYVVGNLGKQSHFFIPEAYVKAKYGKFEIYAGRRKEIFGLVDSTISSGSYAWSGNALPMPKIQIANPDFVPLGFTKGFLSFKGSFAHGWFENTRTDVKDFYLHQKSLYFRLGKPDWKFKFYGGFNHQVQWGGTLKYPDPDNLFSINGQIPSSFNDYLNVVTGKSLAAVGDTTKNGNIDATNRGGNHLGTIDFGFEINANNFSVLCYRQSIYEDGSLAYLSNIDDGLNGISINIKKVSNSKIKVQKIVLEYLNTTSQGGSTGSEETFSRLRGQDNYFNNAVYKNGWTYNQNSLGTPFINNALSINNSSNLFFNNNRVEAYYFAIQSVVRNNIHTNLKLSYSLNNGTYITPLRSSADQFSLLFNCIIPAKFLGGCEILSNIAFNTGKLYNDNLGVYVGVRKYLN